MIIDAIRVLQIFILLQARRGPDELPRRAWNKFVHSWGSALENALYIEPESPKMKALFIRRSYNIVLRGMMVSSLGVVEDSHRCKKVPEQDRHSSICLGPHCPPNHLHPKTCTSPGTDTDSGPPPHHT